MSRHRDHAPQASGRHLRASENSPVNNTYPTYYTVLGPAITLLREHPEDFMRHFLAAALTYDFHFHTFFPSVNDHHASRYTHALRYILEALDQSTNDPDCLDDVIDFLSQLGCDQRKYQLTAEQYQSLAAALRDTFALLLPYQWSTELNDALLTSFEHAINVMQSAAATKTTPPVYTGTVMEVLRFTRDIAIVRLQANPALDYLPGQYLSVTTPQCPGTWRYLSPAIPANSDGYIEFHIRAVDHGYFSNQIVHNTHPGDQWTLSNPHGNLHISGERPVCMIARDMALAPMRCILLDMVQDSGHHPLVDIYYSTHYPGELIDAATLANLQAANPWLIAHICADEKTDPWWLHNAPELPPNLLLRHGNPLEIALADGCIHDREILVGGSPQIVQQAMENLPRLGVSRADIHHDPLD